MQSKTRRIDPFLIVILLLAAFFNLYGIWKDQYSNAYYTATVTSMLKSFHNFFLPHLTQAVL
jgi:4-amino-4-deoxy-L-arabinose transferase-like glycosyltransferase